MKKLKQLTGLLLLLSGSLLAQETPKNLKNVQTESVFAMPPIKIDGKLKEWTAGFQAYNKSTHLYYTMANDDQNLYVVIRTIDATTNAKITAGGITLTINTAGQKKEEGAYSLTYPIIQRPQARPGGMPGGAPGPGQRTMVFMGGPPGGGSAPQGGTDSAMLKAAHERVINAAKEIKVSGFKDIQDSLIAIYNDYKIKAAIDYDKDNAFIYELAIPLKLMGLEAGDKKEFAYNIKLNGLQLNFRLRDDADGPRAGGGAPGGTAPSPVMIFNGPPGGGRGGIDFQELTSVTDFWGKYTLAKK